MPDNPLYARIIRWLAPVVVAVTIVSVAWATWASIELANVRKNNAKTVCAAFNQLSNGSTDFVNSLFAGQKLTLKQAQAVDKQEQKDFPQLDCKASPIKFQSR